MLEILSVNSEVNIFKVTIVFIYYLHDHQMDFILNFDPLCKLQAKFSRLFRYLLTKILCHKFAILKMMLAFMIYHDLNSCVLKAITQVYWSYVCNFGLIKGRLICIFYL